jgi:hypothetical protein
MNIERKKDQEQQDSGEKNHEAKNPSEIAGEGDIAEAQGGHDRQGPVDPRHPGVGVAFIDRDPMKDDGVDGNDQEQKNQVLRQSANILTRRLFAEKVGNLTAKKLHLEAITGLRTQVSRRLGGHSDAASSDDPFFACQWPSKDWDRQVLCLVTTALEPDAEIRRRIRRQESFTC